MKLLLQQPVRWVNNVAQFEQNQDVFWTLVKNRVKSDLKNESDWNHILLQSEFSLTLLCTDYILNILEGIFGSSARWTEKASSVSGLLLNDANHFQWGRFFFSFFMKAGKCLFVLYFWLLLVFALCLTSGKNQRKLRVMKG